MLNQKCTIVFGEMTGYVVDAVTRRQVRGDVSVDVVIAWNDGDITSFPVTEIPINVQIESVLNDVCKVSKGDQLGSIMLFTEAKVMREGDSSVNAIVLWDNSTVSVEPISGLQSVVSANPPSTISLGNGSGSGVTATWVEDLEGEFARSTAGFARVSVNNDGKVKVYIEKELNDEMWLADISKYYIVATELSEDGRYIGVFLNRRANKTDRQFVFYLKNMVDGISATLYQIMQNGGLKVKTDYGLVLEDVLDDEIIEEI